MTDLNAIRARLGSISDTSMSKLPKAVQTLLKEDLPSLLEVAEKHGEFLPKTPEQNIDEIPW